MVQKFTGLNPPLLCDLFDKMILPILSYGSEIWGFHQADAIEKVHREFMKRLLKVKSTTVNEFVYGELGRKPLIYNRYCSIVKYWFKVITASDGRLIKSVYNIQKEYMENHANKVNWVSLLKQLLCENGFGEVWYNQGVGDERCFIEAFKERLDDVYRQTWSLKLGQTRKSMSYRQFHTLGQPCIYLKVINNLKHRHALTRLRTRNNRLHIETGSWSKPPIPYERRYCLCCNTIDLEDEFHFVLICPIYSEVRQKYIPKYYRVRPSMYKFLQLMSTENVSLLRKLSSFVHNAFILRNILMYS